MPDNLGIRLKNRPPDSTSKVAADASIWDTVTDLLENAIEDLTKHGFFEGLLTSPGFSVTNMVVSNSIFQCITGDGVYCKVPEGDVTHDTADPTNPRIDIICVKPEVRLDGEGEIIATGVVEIIKGTAAANPLVPDTPSNYLKVAEVDIPATATEVTLRGWKPMYVKVVMLRPTCQDTPDMTVKVNFFRGYVSGNTLVEKDVQDSPSFTAPASNKCKIDILHIDSSGTLAITQGTEVDLPTEPSAPTYPTDKLVICEVYLETEDTAIYQAQIKDVRPILNLGGMTGVTEDMDFNDYGILNINRVGYNYEITRPFSIASGEFARVILPPGKELYGSVLIQGEGEFLGFTLETTGDIQTLYFEDLANTPSSLVGHGGKFVKVKSDESGLEFVT